MKKLNYFLFFFLFILFSNCKKDSDKIKNNCASVDSFSVVQNQELLNFKISTNNANLYYEVSYQLSNTTNQAESGQIFQVTAKEFTKQISELYSIGNQNGLLAFYVRSGCSQESKSEWKGPIFLQLSQYCSKPYNLNIVKYSNSNTALRWEHTQNVNAYQVQYGLQGFAIDNGTTINSNTKEISNIPLQADKTYDFYVRALCNSVIGWSNWTGPLTYFSPDTQNMCNAPSNLVSYNQGNGYYRVVWARNGGNSFEYVLTNSINAPITNIQLVVNNGEITVYTGNLSKYFRVRSVCNNGSRTDWVGLSIP